MNNSQYSQVPDQTLMTPAQAKQTAREELSRVVDESHQLIAKATTVFPFTLFPDTIALDRTKITITHRDFFKVGETISIRVEDILHIVADVGPLFGSVQIATRYFDKSKPYRVNFLWRQDALRIKRITQGYIIAMQREIDCSALNNAELASLLNQLGQGGAADRV